MIFEPLVASDADLLTKLGEPGNYTVFAATDAAFDQLSEEMKNKLGKGKSCIQSKYLTTYLMDSYFYLFRL